MAIVDDTKPVTTDSPNQNRNPRILEDGVKGSQSSPQPQPPPQPQPRTPTTPKDSIIAVASNIAAQSFPCSDPEVWGVLTAISTKARKLRQGMNILLTANEHVIGRVVDDACFQIVDNAVSQRHCQILKKPVSKEEVDNPSGVCKAAFLKDTSTNGTYLNWERLKRGSLKSEAGLVHGDIISLAAPPQYEHAYAFVYREVTLSVPSSDGVLLKRKAEDFGPENKRLKGIGLGASENPISLDDFRSLQRSNTELRKQVENHVLTIDTLRKENHEVLERHQTELTELREAVSNTYSEKLNELEKSLEVTKNELSEANKSSSAQKHAIEDLNERLSTALQSCTEANEIVKSQKTSIAELKTQLANERDLRREEREKAAADLNASIQKVQSEAEEELRRVSDAASKQEKELQEVISNLQESERNNSLLVEDLRSKLTEIREQKVDSDNRIRQLELQVVEEQRSSDLRKKQLEELEFKAGMMKEELDKEKEARKEAWARVTELQVEITDVMGKLDCERRRLKGARERIMLRETQLRAFYSTTEEIKLLFDKQQEQLKSMQNALKDDENYDDEENYDNASLDTTGGNVDRIGPKAGPSTAAKLGGRCGVDETFSEEDSATEKHDCNIGTQDDNTQEAEFPNDEGLVKGGFGSAMDGIGTAPVGETDADGTERVPEVTETPGADGERKFDLNNTANLAGDTMQLEEDTNVQETEPQSPVRDSRQREDSGHNASGDGEQVMIRTQDLLASEVAGSWACSTAPSFYGDNESAHNDERENHMGANDLNTQVAESQNTVNTPLNAPSAKMHSDHDIQALSNMIGIMEPDVQEQFGSFARSTSREKNAVVSEDDSETDDECVETSKNIVDGESDDETQGADDDLADKIHESEEGMDVDDTEEDSVG